MSKHRRLVTIKLWTSAGMARISEHIGEIGTIKSITTNDATGRAITTAVRADVKPRDGSKARESMHQRVKQSEVAARTFLYDNQNATVEDLGKFLTDKGYTNRYNRPWDGRVLQRYYDRAFEQISRPADLVTTNLEG